MYHGVKIGAQQGFNAGTEKTLAVLMDLVKEKFDADILEIFEEATSDPEVLRRIFGDEDEE